jgi:hypothetical protein
MKIFYRFNWKKIKSSKLPIYGIVILVVVSLFFFGRWQTKNAKDVKDEIINNQTIVVGKIQRLKRIYKGLDRFEYTFYFNNNLHTGWSNSSGTASDYNDLSRYVYGKEFPVILSPSDPQKYSRILIVPEDFEAYGLKFPDSLRWVLEYIDR